MPEFGFYHLTRSPLEVALPRLMEKIHGTGKRSLLRLGSGERLEAVDRALWIYETDSWLPHGTTNEPYPDRQPILLDVCSSDAELRNLNDAQILVLAEQPPASDALHFERVLELFDGNNNGAVDAARQRWTWAKERGFDLVYWQQNERGGWKRAR